MKNVKRYTCGNGEGMFYDKKGYWVTYEDYKLLLDKYDKLALTIPVVSDTLILTPADAKIFFNEIMNPKEANEALKKAMLKFITR